MDLRGIFVAGTDTNVGKTLVGTGLLRLAAARGLPVLPFKPAESGCRQGRPADALRLRAAARRLDLPLPLVCPFPLRLAVAPASAAEAEGLRLGLPSFRRAARRLLKAGEALFHQTPRLFVEAAGGLLSPYDRRLTCADLAADLGLPILLVARDGLGAINHTALCLAEIRRRNLPLAGLILVRTKPMRGPKLDNARLIQQLTGVRAFGTVPYLPSRRPDDVAAALRTSVERKRLDALLDLLA